MLDFEKQVKPYLEVGEDGLPTNKDILGTYYHEAVKYAQEIAQVSGDDYPEFLNIERPRELAEHKKYREDIFKNPTLSFFTKATNSVRSIPNTDDYQISWPDLQGNTNEELSLKSYLGKGIKRIGSFQNWFWETASDNYIYDPNGVLMVIPLTEPESDKQFKSPEPLFIPSKCVIKHQKGMFAVLLLPDTHPIKVENGKIENVGRTLFIIDQDSYTVCKQLERKKNTQDKTDYIWSVRGLAVDYSDEENVRYNFQALQHNCEDMPVFSLGNVRNKDNSYGEVLYDSIINDGIPHIKSALQRNSDIEIEFLHHVHTIEWFKKSVKCDYDNGEGVKCEDGHLRIRTEKGVDVQTCPKCKGTGVPAGPLAFMWVQTGAEVKSFDIDSQVRDSGGQPGGFIERNIESVKVMIEKFDADMRSAYRSIDAEFLYESPLATSGTSKSYDRQEFYRLLATVADHVINGVLFPVIKCIDAQRFYTTSAKGQQLPAISVPRDTFDLSTIDEILDQIEKVNDPEIEYALQLKLAEKKFGVDSTTRKRIALKSDCDPYPRMDNNNKREQLLLELASYRLIYSDDSEDYKEKLADVTFSLNIDKYIQELSNDDAEFWNRSHEDRKKKLLAMRKSTKEMRLRPISEVENPTEVRPLIDIKNTKQV